MKRVQLANSMKSFIVDDEDYNRIVLESWHYGEGSIKACINDKTISVGQFLLNYYDPLNVDHKDRNIFNNQRENLRKANKSQNGANVGLSDRNTSGYKGVSWYPKSQKWKVSISINRKYVHIGYFNTKEEAALAYNKKAIELYGEFAYQNRMN